MNIVDAIIILCLLFGSVIGFKRGFFKQTVIFIGTIAVIVLAFILRTPVSQLMYKYFPFFDFDGLSSLNIILYEGVAFLLVFIILTVLLKILIFAAGGLEKVLNFTIILGIPSKILGAVVGFFQYYLIVYIALIFVASPLFNIKSVNESELKNKILNETFIFSNLSRNIINTFDEIIELRKTESNEELNNKIYDIIEKNGIMAKEKIDHLIKSEKMKG